MDENAEAVNDEPTPVPAPAVGAGRDQSSETGNPAVDQVLRSLDGLDARPVDEHVAVFEAAHEDLRRALSEAGDTPPRPGPGT